ncbi:MAG: macrolide ABC transporter ATP-binding protein [Parcubacteria group bacterium CG11_big_fil_rev_8_21_14_0_20_39_22]|nr:MAG: macrolide ABC transporter ATP-binding protein [Parcubacteria group bacterium CG11_big_fil_rev_8_21_14_0_20_39_22]
MEIINAINLEKTYYTEGLETRAVRDVSLTISRGEFVAIIGPSGSGKSTLLHILGFIDPNTGGEYFFEGKNVNDYSDDEKAFIRNKRIGFVFQSFNLLARTSVLENVKLPLLYSDVPEKQWDERAKKAIDAVGLTHRLLHEPSELSGGEKQRVAIARALIREPEIIFADEPTGNLDSASGKSIMEILQKLNEEKNHTIVLITHETYTAEHAERIISLRDGLVERDSKVEKRNMASEFKK